MSHDTEDIYYKVINGDNENCLIRSRASETVEVRRD